MTKDKLHKSVSNFQLKHKTRPIFGPFYEIYFCRTSPVPGSHKLTKLLILVVTPTSWRPGQMSRVEKKKNSVQAYRKQLGKGYKL